MKNHASGRTHERPTHERLNWKPLVAASKHPGEPAHRAAFISLPAWPGYRDALATAAGTVASETACQRLSLSAATDSNTHADADTDTDAPQHSS
jgi:hypothetical protein